MSGNLDKDIVNIFFILRVFDKYIKIFTSLPKNEIDTLIAEQQAAPHLRPLQKRLAEEITIMVHSCEEYEKAVSASEILFGRATSETLREIDEETLLQVFEGVPQFNISRKKLAEGIKAVDLLTEEAAVFPSKGEMRKTVQAGGVMLNKTKLAEFDAIIDSSVLIGDKYILAQRGKKNYYLLTAV
jgi:tyrosyl-tRNA synthetase